MFLNKHLFASMGAKSACQKSTPIYIVFLFVFSLFSVPVFADSTITLTVSSESVVLTLAPKSTQGTFIKSSNLGIQVSLSGPGGYTLGISSGSTGANATKLVNTMDNTKYFTSIPSAISESDFSNSSNTQYNNTWGYLPSKFYSQDNTSYRPAPDEIGDIIDQTSGTDETGNYTLAIGARANTDTVIGTYTSSVIITAISNMSCYPNATNIRDALCMQDINDDVINSMEEDRQYQLRDNRDWKTYYIAKMKDGRVWMTQNLDLDLETTPSNVATLTHDNTDLGWTVLDTNATWTPSVATVTTAADYGANSSTTPASFDYGETYRYVSTTGITTSYSTTSACETAHNDGTCPHYHVGNYYNWSAAVASDDTSAITANYTTAPNSICPAGWRLPTGRESSSATSYGEINYTWVNEGLATNYVADTSTATYSPDNATGWNNIRQSPMYMVAAGYKNGTSSVSNLGSYGYFWTNTVYSNTTAYAPYAYSSGLYPTYYSTSSTVRGRGLSIRCVARQANTGSTTITFDKNASDATGITGTNNAATYNANTLNTLPANGFTRTGYAFNSWNTAPDGSGTSYQDAAQYYARTGTAATAVTLYAQWDKVYTITFSIGANATGIYFDGTTYTNGQTVQAIENQTCQISGVFPTKYGLGSWSTTAGTIANSSAPTTTYTVVSDATITVTGQEATTSISTLTVPTDPVSSNCKNEAVIPQLVYDPRDNEAYYVARLCDGNIWMLDNLRLDLTNSTIINSLSSTNTNATDAQLNYLKNGGGTATDQYPTAGLSGSEWTIGYSYSVPQAAARYKDDIAPVTFGLGTGKNGVYYNYCATSAGTYCWGNGTGYTGSPTTDPVTDSYRDIEGDICPAGWHLPNYTGEFAALASAYSGGGTLGGDTVLSYAVAHNTALSTPLSGYLGGGSSRSNLGTNGRFWSSTWNSTYTMYSRSVTATSVSSGGYSRIIGSSIRCVFGGGRTTISFNKNANDATGTMSDIVVTGGTWAKISNSFSRSGYVFNNWNTEPDGSGTSYTDIYTASKNITQSITLYAQWNLNQTIVFDANEATTTTGVYTGTMNNQTINSGSSATLTANNYSISGYLFNSWNTASDGSGTSYENEAVYSVPSSNTDATITLYAIWDKAYTITFVTLNTDGVVFDGTTYANGQSAQAVAGKTYSIYGDYPTRYAFSSWSATSGTLENSDRQRTIYTAAAANATITLTGQYVSTAIQNLSPSSCTTTPSPVYDTRDNEVYWIGELADGNCWIMDNLRFNPIGATITTSNTNSDGTIKTYSHMDIMESGTSYYTNAYVNISHINEISSTTYGYGSGKKGVFYNYCAATAGTYCVRTNDRTSAEYDLCPAGWRLPTGGTDGELKNLVASYNGFINRFRNGLSTNSAGYVSSYGYSTSWFYIWSSTTFSSGQNAYHLLDRNTQYNAISSDQGDGRYNGGSVRCVLDKD